MTNDTNDGNPTCKCSPSSVVCEPCAWDRGYAKGVEDAATVVREECLRPSQARSDRSLASLILALRPAKEGAK